MERYYVGLDVSKEKTAICVRRSDGSMDKACETRSDPDAIFAALAPFRDGLERVILETGRMANWLYDELTRRGLPVRHQIIWDPECSAGQEGLAHTVRV
ncbi:hypothetical protein [Salipiger bermudensis]|uniref:hypothetical protein n=1 Tax=Salipiger bermudensis TaxID=344736 RepID=UPI001CD1D530|nr:hypothetical protein [Salipiger bermudensis]MCA1288685.1 hypothetical protein [Salipiger bermudensis]